MRQRREPANDRMAWRGERARDPLGRPLPIPGVCAQLRPRHLWLFRRAARHADQRARALLPIQHHAALHEHHAAAADPHDQRSQHHCVSAGHPPAARARTRPRDGQGARGPNRKTQLFCQARGPDDPQPPEQGAQTARIRAPRPCVHGSACCAGPGAPAPQRPAVTPQPLLRHAGGTGGTQQAPAYRPQHGTPRPAY